MPIANHFELHSEIARADRVLDVDLARLAGAAVLEEERDVRGEGADEREEDAEVEAHSGGRQRGGPAKIAVPAATQPSVPTPLTLRKVMPSQPSVPTLRSRSSRAESARKCAAEQGKPRLAGRRRRGHLAVGLRLRTARPDGAFCAVDGMPHFLSAEAGRHLHAPVASVRSRLVHGLGGEGQRVPPGAARPPRPAAVPELRPPRRRPGTTMPGHWKLGAIDAYVGRPHRSRGSTTPSTTPVTHGRASAPAADAARRDRRPTRG